MAARNTEEPFGESMAVSARLSFVAMGRELILRAVRTRPEQAASAAAAAKLRQAMLEVVGERGYAAASVQRVVERSGISRHCFGRHFADREECFAKAQEEASELLFKDVLAAVCSAESWIEATLLGLAELLRFVEERPLVSRAMLIESSGAGGRPAEIHERMVERYVSLLEIARNVPAADRAAPAPTAQLVVGGIVEMLRHRIAMGRTDGMSELLPGMAYFVLVNYVDEDTARSARRAGERMARTGARPVPGNAAPTAIGRALRDLGHHLDPV